jgi:hypothetical protein
MVDENLALLRSRRNNISRYRRLLNTNLTDLELGFIEKRLAEETLALDSIVASTFPLSFRLPTSPAVMGSQ